MEDNRQVQQIKYQKIDKIQELTNNFNNFFQKNQNFIEEIGYSVSCSAQNKKSFLSSVSNLLGIMTENSVEYLLKLELEKINYICKFNYQEVQRLLEIGEFLQLSIQEQKLQQQKKRESIRKLANDKIQLYHERLKMQKLQQEGVESDKNINQQNQIQENKQQQKNEDEQQQQLKQKFINSQILVIDQQVKYKNEGENKEENQENKLEQGLIRESQKQKIEIEQKNNKQEDIQKQIENQKSLDASIENDKNTKDKISLNSIDQELQNSKTSVKTLGNKDQICSLCLDNNVQIVYPCYHSYCQDCSNQWIIGKNQQSCPVCRKDFGKIYGSLSQFQRDVFYLQAKQDIQDNIKNYKEDLMKIFKSKNKLIPFKSLSQSGNILYLQASQISNNQ